MACSFAFGTPRQLGPLAGLEHGRTIPLADVNQPSLMDLDFKVKLIREAYRLTCRNEKCGLPHFSTLRLNGGKAVMNHEIASNH